jgi:hypothetical protein
MKNTLEFSKLMYAWHLAKCNVDLRGDVESIQEEKDCYAAILDYIDRSTAPNAPVSRDWRALEEEYGQHG